MGEAVRKSHIMILREQFEALMKFLDGREGDILKDHQDFGVLKPLLPLLHAWRKRRPKV